MRKILSGAVITGLVGLGGAARADIVLLADGAVADGRVLKQDSTEVVLQPDGAKLQKPRTFERGRVARIILTDDRGTRLSDSDTPASGGATTGPAATRPSPAPTARWTPPPAPLAPPIEPPPSPAPGQAAATYYLIPLHGTVGFDIRADVLEKSLADAVTRKPTVVILDIESPGGLVSEATAMIGVLHRYSSQLRIVALAGRDLSAAAVFTLPCREIYLRPGGTIGAATAYRPDRLWLPPKIEEKLQSAWRAEARACAEAGGHDALLGEAMVQCPADLHIESSGGKPVIRLGPGDKMLCQQGKVLTLTPREAIDCGLAAGQVGNYEELGQALGLAGWRECQGLGTLLAKDLQARQKLAETESHALYLQFLQNIEDARSTMPGEAIFLTHEIVPGSSIRTEYETTTTPIYRATGSPGRPYYPRPGAEGHGVLWRTSPVQRPGAPILLPRVQATPDVVDWERKSLLTVISLQQAEQNVKDVVVMYTSMGFKDHAEQFASLQAKLAARRGAVYDQRHKYSSAVASSASAGRAPADLSAAMEQLASSEMARQTAAAKWLGSAAVDTERQGQIIDLLRPFLDGDDARQHAPFVRAFAHWAGKEQAADLLHVLQYPQGAPQGHDLCWAPALAALVRLDAAAAEKVIEERKDEFYFRATALDVLEGLARENGPDQATAKRLLGLIPHPRADAAAAK